MTPTRLSFLVRLEGLQGRPRHSLSIPENWRKVIQRPTQLLMILQGAQIHILPILDIHISFGSQRYSCELQGFSLIIYSFQEKKNLF